MCLPHLPVDITGTRPTKSTAVSDVTQCVYGEPPFVVAVKRWRYGDISAQELDEQNSRVEETIAADMRIQHPNILSYLGISDLDGVNCIVTPWAEQGTITEFLEKNQTADRRSLLVQVATALEHLHSQKPVIVHGDLHANNVLITGEGRAVVSDFGLYNIIPDSSLASISLPWLATPRGRLLLKAPELRVKGAQPSVASDVFAFGVLMWVVFADGPPFRDLGAPQAAAAFQRGERPPLTEITRADFTPEMRRIVEDCWAQAPEKRPSMSAVRTRLERGTLPMTMLARLSAALRGFWAYLASAAWG